MVKNENLGKIVGDNVRRIRNLKHITQEKLSEKSGVAVNTIRNLEKGRWPSEKTLMSVADALEIEAKFLLSASDDRYYLREEIAGKFQGFMESILKGDDNPLYTLDHVSSRK